MCQAQPQTAAVADRLAPPPLSRAPQHWYPSHRQPQQVMRFQHCSVAWTFLLSVHPVASLLPESRAPTFRSAERRAAPRRVFCGVSQVLSVWASHHQAPRWNAQRRRFRVRHVPHPDVLGQGFSTCGARTPGGPRGASKGSAGNPRKTGDPSHIN